MRTTLPSGETRVHVSLMRPERKLLAQCDRDKFWDLVTVCGLSFFGLHSIEGVIFAIGVAAVGFPLLAWIGAKQPFFFPIYARANNQQATYRRSSHAGTPFRGRGKDKHSVW